MLKAAGFQDIKVETKEGAADIIKGWMPGTGAEKYVTSVYVTATKPAHSWGLRDDVRHCAEYQDVSSCCEPPAAGGSCGPGA